MKLLTASAVAFIVLCLFPLQAHSQGGTRYIPHITSYSTVWNDVLQVDNRSSQAASFTITLYDQGVMVYSGSMDVPGFSYRGILLKNFAPSASVGVITTTASDLEFRLAFESVGSGGVAEFALSDDLASQLGFSFANFASFVAWKGIAVMNAGTSTETVTLYAIGGGHVLAAAVDTIPARSRLVGTHTSWFPGIPLAEIEQIVVVGQGSDLTGISISGSTDASSLLYSTAVPVHIFDDNGLPPVSSEYVVFAWNDLGMHCLNPTYDKAVILPPYNTVWAQVVQKGNPPRVVTSGVSVEYRILNNTFSYGKRSYGQFWDFCPQLFGVSLQPDTGLNLKNPSLHNSLAGFMQPAGDHFEVDGIPVTPVKDDLTYDPYQIAEVTVKDSAGTVLARTQATVPVSDQIDCARCHGQDAFQDILEKHPSVGGATLVSRAPVLCASCHGSPALGSAPGERGSSGQYLSEAIHGSHATRSAACYDCHPSVTARCNRSIAHDAADGNCVTCHGTMAQLAQQISSNTKVPWVDEPRCVTCHAVTGVDTGATLYRNAAGHGSMYCAACHHSPHAMVPSRAATDNYQALQYQGAALAIGSCGACHRTSRGPSGDISEFSETHAGLSPEHRSACHVCHTAVSTTTASWPHSFNWNAR